LRTIPARIQVGGVYSKRRSESNFKGAKCRSSGPALVRSTERDLELYKTLRYVGFVAKRKNL